MKIDGKAIADKILSNLSQEVGKLKERGMVPTLAVILVGDNPASLSYIKQKQKAAEQIGAKIELCHVSSVTSQEELKKLVEKYNNDPNIHGIIVQRPLPAPLENSSIVRTIEPSKDVDGFVPNSPFTVPVAKAVLTILEEVFNLEKSHPASRIPHNVSFADWLKTQCSVVIGRGETAGKPITNTLGERGCMISVVHSKSGDPTEVIKKMNIVVSCVGKERVVTAPMLAPNTILIGVGIWRDETGKLRGDYEEDEIKDVTAYYTPTPGGVGPVNVACLMQNLVLAAQKMTH